MLRAGGVARERVRILSCDAASTSAQAVRSVADVQLVGGGGTDMRVGIDAGNAARPAPHVVIVLTDGDTPWPDRPSRAHLVCAVIGNDARTVSDPGMGVTCADPGRCVVNAVSGDLLRYAQQVLTGTGHAPDQVGERGRRYRRGCGGAGLACGVGSALRIRWSWRANRRRTCRERGMVRSGSASLCRRNGASRCSARTH